MKFFWSALSVSIAVIMFMSLGCKREKIDERNFWEGNVQFNPSAFGNRWSEFMPEGFLAEVEYWTRLPNPRFQYWKPVLEGVFAPNEWSIYHAELEDEVDEFVGLPRRWKPVVPRIQIGWCWLVAFYIPYRFPSQRAIFAVSQLDAKKVAEKLLAAARGGEDDWLSFFPSNLPWEDPAFGGYKRKVTASSRVRKKFPGLFKKAGMEELALGELEFEVADVLGSSVHGGTADWVIALNDHPYAATAKTIVAYGRGWIIKIMHPFIDEGKPKPNPNPNPNPNPYVYAGSWVWYPPQKVEGILKSFTKTGNGGSTK